MSPEAALPTTVSTPTAKSVGEAMDTPVLALTVYAATGTSLSLVTAPAAILAA